VWQAVALVVVLGLLGWGADALARFGAVSVIAGNVQTATGATTRPQVTIKGRLFLPQVIRGSYDEVDVSVRDVTNGKLHLARVDAVLRQVRVPLHDVLVQDVRRIAVGRSREHVTLHYDDLNSYFKATNRAVELAPASNGKVKLTGSVKVLGQSVKASGQVELGVANGALTVKPGKAAAGSNLLDQATRSLLSDRLSFTVPLDSLPFGQQLTAVAAHTADIGVRAAGSDIVLTP